MNFLIPDSTVKFACFKRLTVILHVISAPYKRSSGRGHPARRLLRLDESEDRSSQSCDNEGDAYLESSGATGGSGGGAGSTLRDCLRRATCSGDSMSGAVARLGGGVGTHDSAGA